MEELYLELQDTQWPQQGIDHDRQIVRAVVVDDDGYFYFVRAVRDDDFGSATLIETSGGGVEKGEELLAAIRRELNEELGAQVDVLGRIGTVSDYYNLIHRHNINHYYLCRVVSFGDKHLMPDEIEDFHLSTLRLRYEDALQEYQDRACTPIGRLIASRELPILRQAKGMLDREVIPANGKPYHVLSLLGRGKGGYSYLVECNGQQFVLKQIHHEPCGYYQFGNKIESERGDCQRLLRAGIRIPQMLDVDMENERIIKEYIAGDTIFDYVKRHEDATAYLAQVREMARQARDAGLNIDYFPTNFVVRDGLLWYIDYECNTYMDEWNFENWGIRYWSRTPEFEEYLREHG